MFKNRLGLVKNLMQIIHITLRSYVQVRVAYVLILFLTFLNIFVYLFFYYYFLGSS